MNTTIDATNLETDHAQADRAIAVRAYPVIMKQPPNAAKTLEASAVIPSKAIGKTSELIGEWPRRALIFDCETRIDASQRLTVGFAVVLKSNWRTRQHVVERIILFGDPDALAQVEQLTIASWREQSLVAALGRLEHRPTHVQIPADLEVDSVSIETFREIFYYYSYKARAVVVGFNLSFDLSRIAVRATPTKDKQGFTFTLIDHEDSRGRRGTKVRHPRIQIKPIDGRRALIQFTGTKPRYDGRFLDLKTLADALTGRKHSLKTACKEFGIGAKKEHEHDGRVTRGLLDYALRDVLISTDLYVAEMEAYRRHPIAKAPNRIFSEASIGKAYLDSMGLKLPELVVDPALDLTPTDAVTSLREAALSTLEDDRAHRIQGLTTTTYFGGRTETRIRNVLTPVAYCDFLSMYPTVNSLQGLWDLVTADKLHVVDATEEVQRFLAYVTPEALFDPETWKKLPAIVQVDPDGATLPTRAKHGDETYSAYGIGVNPLYAERPLWFALADCVAATLRDGRPPKVLRALRFVPEGKQTLKAVKLRGQVAIDPNREDFFRAVIAERTKVKKRIGPYKGLSMEEADSLQQFLKILVNATAYGIYMEMNREDGKTEVVRSHGLEVFEGEIDNPESLGPFCFPVLSTLITAGARLMLELAALEVRSRGGRYVFMDTDSIAIVATDAGSVVACPNGDRLLEDGRDSVRALTFAEVEAIRERFRSLNPYGSRDSILELEEENFARCSCGNKDHKSAKSCTGERRPLIAYSSASKRYALANLNDGAVDVRKYSEHGLGAFAAPTDADGQRIDKWERELWRVLIDQARGADPQLPSWAHQTIIAQVRIATPEQLRWFDAYNRTTSGEPKSYGESVKPSNFLSHALIKPLSALRNGRRALEVCLVALAGERRRFVDRHAPEDGLYEAGIDFTPKTYGDVMQSHDLHPERKFAGPDGMPCQPGTRGLLTDLPVVATRIKHVGKEGNEIDEQEAGVIDEAERSLEYHDSEFDDFVRKLRKIPTKTIAEATGYNERTARRLKRGEFRPSSERLRALRDLISEL